MPVNLRRTLLFASALQVLGPTHGFTAMMQQLLSGTDDDDAENAVLERLPDSERFVLLDRYQTIVSDMPINIAAA